MCLIYLSVHPCIQLSILCILTSIPLFFSNNPTNMMDGIGVGGIDYEDKLTPWLIQYYDVCLMPSFKIVLINFVTLCNHDVLIFQLLSIDRLMD